MTLPQIKIDPDKGNPKIGIGSLKFVGYFVYKFHLPFCRIVMEGYSLHEMVFSYYFKKDI